MKRKLKRIIKQELQQELSRLQPGQELSLFNNWTVTKAGKDFELFGPGNLEQPDVITADLDHAVKVLLKNWTAAAIRESQFYKGEL